MSGTDGWCVIKMFIVNLKQQQLLQQPAFKALDLKCTFRGENETHFLYLWHVSRLIWHLLFYSVTIKNLSDFHVHVNKLMSLCPRREEEVRVDSESMTLVNRKLLNTSPEGNMTHLPGHEYPMKDPFNVEMKKGTHLLNCKWESISLLSCA